MSSPRGRRFGPAFLPPRAACHFQEGRQAGHLVPGVPMRGRGGGEAFREHIWFSGIGGRPVLGACPLLPACLEELCPCTRPTAVLCAACQAQSLCPLLPKARLGVVPPAFPVRQPKPLPRPGVGVRGRGSAQTGPSHAWVPGIHHVLLTFGNSDSEGIDMLTASVTRLKGPPLQRCESWRCGFTPEASLSLSWSFGLSLPPCPSPVPTAHLFVLTSTTRGHLCPRRLWDQAS